MHTRDGAHKSSNPSLDSSNLCAITTLLSSLHLQATFTIDRPARRMQILLNKLTSLFITQESEIVALAAYVTPDQVVLYESIQPAPNVDVSQPLALTTGLGTSDNPPLNQKLQSVMPEVTYTCVVCPSSYVTNGERGYQGGYSDLD